MRHKMVLVKNVSRLSEAGHALLARAPGMPGMGLIHGETGYGKTTAVTWYVNQCHGVYVRAISMWSPSAMLQAILRELDEAPRASSCANMVGQIVQSLALSGRPLFLDEADYIVEEKRMVETLRDLHDLASVPVVLIGMAGVHRKIAARQQLSGRIARWVEFKPCDLDDAGSLARDLCEVEVAPDLVERLHQAAAGSVRLMVVGLAGIEAEARTRGLRRIESKDWTKQRDFFFGEAPRRSRRQPAASTGETQ